MRHVVVMMAKAPVAGTVKTRLGKTIGNERSAEFHTAFIADLCAMLRKVATKRVLSFAGVASHPGFDAARDAEFEFIEQPGGDLGERLSTIVKTMFNRGFESVIVLGSDSPTLSQKIIVSAQAQLTAGAPVVLGPSFDGGYYLIGLRADAFADQLHSKTLSVFDGISWSTTAVMGETLRACVASQHRCQLLSFWYDVDTIEDLKFLRDHLDGYGEDSEDFPVNTSKLLRNIDHAVWSGFG